MKRPLERITSGRAKRMFSVGSLTTQVGGAYLLQSLLKPFRSVTAHEREMLETHVRSALLIVERSKEVPRGAFTKLVQMLSMRDDLLPAEALDILGSVQSSVPPMSFTQIREVVRAELGKPPEKLFASFERDAFAAASLGQVHAAETKDGRSVVVKIQYPGVGETVDQDLQNVDALLQLVGRIAKDVFGKPADVGALRRELEERLREELDYVREAANLARFRELFADDEEIELPEVDPTLSSRRVLTMTRLDGYPLADILAPGIDQEMKDWVARKYYRIFWRQLLRFGCLHTDPHPGNYRVTHHPHLGILDFGSVRAFPDSVREAYVALARAVLERDRPRMVAAARSLDFLGRDDPEAAFVEVLEILLEPLLADRDYDPAEYRTLDKAMRVASLVVEHRLFQNPGHRVFLMRALIGLESLVKQLGTVANWRQMLAEELPAVTRVRSAGPTLEALVLFLALVAFFALAQRGFGVTWDESMYFRFSDSVREWFSGGAPLDAESLDRSFAYSYYHNPHPPLLKILSAATAAAVNERIEFPLSYRLSYHLFIAGCLGIGFLALRGRMSPFASLAAVAFVVLQPRLLAEFLIGTTDGPTAVLWFVVPLALWRASTDDRQTVRWWAVVFGLCAAAATTKFTASLVALPMIGYLAFRREGRDLARFLTAVACGIGFFLLTSPEAWDTPTAAVVEFLSYPFRREEIPISNWFLGRRYDFFLPWSYFSLISLATVPLGLWLALPTILLARIDARDVVVPTLFACAFWIVVGHWPSTPKHDGIRQLAGFYPCLALLAWRGLLALELRSPVVSRAAMGSVAVALAVTLFSAHPHERSYYGEAVGGIRGAESLGLEICYDFDAVDREFLAAMNREIRPGARVLVLPPWPDLFRLYQDKGQLRRDIELVGPGPEESFQYAILVRRRGYMDDGVFAVGRTLHEVRYAGVGLAKLVALE